MTRTDAIKWLSNLKMDIGKTQHQELWHYEQALDEIIRELPPKDIPKEASDDLISRQDAIDALVRSSVYAWSAEENQIAHDWALKIISELPTKESDEE